MKLSRMLFDALASSESVGIDIGDYNVKVAQVEKAPFKQKAIVSLGIGKINPERTPARIVEAIKEACADAKINTKEARASISIPTTIIRYLIMPSMSEGDLAKALEFEIEKHTPYTLSEMSYQYSVLSSLPNKQIMVLLAIAQKKMIQDRISFIKDAGLEVSSVSIDPLAIIKAFNATVPLGKNKIVIAVLDIGYHQSKLVVFSGDVPYFSRDIPVGGHNFNQAIAEKMGIDFAEAERVKYDPRGQEDEIVKIITPHLHNLIDELSLSFNYCERCLQKTISQLYLIGGEAKVNKLDSFFEENFKLKTSLWNPVLSLRLSQGAGHEKQGGLGHLFAIAIGLGVST